MNEPTEKDVFLALTKAVQSGMEQAATEDKMIRRFADKYWFLSNFYPCKILYEKRAWPTAEHLFQGLKVENWLDKFTIRTCKTPAEARRIGRHVEMRPNWDNIRLDIMRMVLSLKFRQSPMLKLKLLGTGVQILVEGNNWHDNFWGDCQCKKCKNIKGENHLGRLLMEVRHGLS